MRIMTFKRTKSILIRLIISSSLSMLICLNPFYKAFATQSEGEHTATLVSEAQKEGKVMLYTTSNVLDATTMLKKFEQRYPFVKAEFYRAGTESLMNRSLIEQQSNRFFADVIMIPTPETHILKEKRVYEKYFSPHREHFLDKDPEGYWTALYQLMITCAYSTKLVSVQEAPKTYQDLLDPKWKGKMGIDTKQFYWFAAVIKMMGEKNGLDYMRKLAEQNLRFRTGMSLNAQMIAAGEISIGITIYNYRIEKMKSQGAPVEWIAMDPVIPEIHPIGVTFRAPHPNAARLLLDWFLSRDGQEVVASIDRIPCRIGVDPNVPKLKKGLNIDPYDFNIVKDYQKYVNLYRKILMKK